MPHTYDSQHRSFRLGPLTAELEPLFLHLQRYPRRRVAPVSPPLTEVARPLEVEDPYRVGVGRAFRLWPTRRAIVVGYWQPAGEPVLEEEQSGRLLEAIEGAHIPGITATEISTWARALDVVSWWRRLLARLLPSTTPPAGAQEGSGEPESGGYRTVAWSKLDEAAVIDLEDARVGLPTTIQSAL